MKVNQLYDVLNDVVDQMSGVTNIQVTDLTSFLSLGNAVVSSTANLDNFYKKLFDKVAKMIFAVRAYQPNTLETLREGFEFGAILQKISMQLMTATTDPAWTLQNGQTVSQDTVTINDIVQTLFSDINAWEIPLTVPDTQIKTAFNSPEQMAAFIDSIFITVENSMKFQLFNTVKMCFMNFIGEKWLATTGTNKVNLIEQYYNEEGTNLKAKDAYHNPDFLRWCSGYIERLSNRLADMTVLYNTKGMYRHTPKDRQRFTFLDTFTTAVKTAMQSVTFNDEFVTLPNYNDVTAWQAINDPDTINIKTVSGSTVNISGVIGVITDYDALGTTIKDEKVLNYRNQHGEFENYWYKANIGYFNDLSENGIVLVMQDYTPPTP